MTRVKKSAFWLIMLLTPVVLSIIVVEGYYFYGYLSLRADFCRPFAQLDDELGWTLTPNVESCVIGRVSAFGAEAFRANVFTDDNGGRSVRSGGQSPVGGLLAIGDSWTFGYGIDGADTFAARLSADHDRPTALFASPAYSGAQALLLAHRVAPTLKPRVIVYLEHGFWGRAVCSGRERPTRILKPCYWVDGDGIAHLIVPPPGYVRRMAAFGLRPGGMVGAGDKTLGYFLIARPAAKLKGLMVRLGFRSGFADDFAPIAPDRDLEAIKQAHGQKLTELAAALDATLVLIDPAGIYARVFEGQKANVSTIYIGNQRWHREVRSQMASLLPEDARVPADGHYGPGVHRLIATMIDRALDSRAE